MPMAGLVRWRNGLGFAAIAALFAAPLVWSAYVGGPYSTSSDCGDVNPRRESDCPEHGFHQDQVPDLIVVGGIVVGGLGSTIGAILANKRIRETGPRALPPPSVDPVPRVRRLAGIAGAGAVLAGLVLALAFDRTMALASVALVIAALGGVAAVAGIVRTEAPIRYRWACTLLLGIFVFEALVAWSGVVLSQM